MNSETSYVIIALEINGSVGIKLAARCKVAKKSFEERRNTYIA